MKNIDAPVNPRRTRLHPIGVSNVKITGGAWALWQRENASTTFPHASAWLEKDGGLDNFRRLDASSDMTAPRRGMWFSDSDVYKTLESAAWEIARRGGDTDLEIRLAIDEFISLIAAVQEDDGYINTHVQAGLAGRWENLQSSHELYCLGHLIQAAVAHHRATEDRRLLDVAVRAADRIVADFGQRRRKESDGHQEIEMALVELYRTTGTQSYLDLAKQFIDDRGRDVFTPTAEWPVDRIYLQDDVPLRERTRIAGHAVRAMYYLSGAVDVAVESGDEVLLKKVQQIAEDIAASQLYITGALGSRAHKEELGDAHELPQDLGYGETCATIGHIGLSWRLLLATGDETHADLIERSLYNLFSASTALDRRGFFYSNPGHRRRLLPAAPEDDMPDRADAPGTRPAWFWCACCPPNIMRTVASLGSLAVTSDSAGIYIHQFFPGLYQVELEEGLVTFEIVTSYPDDGRVSIIVTESPKADWRLSIRQPGWSPTAHAQVVSAGDHLPPKVEYVDRRVSVRRRWGAGDRLNVDFPIEPRWTVGHPAADAVRGTVALERGPVVYALESHDQDAEIDLETVEVDTNSPLEQVELEIAGKTVSAFRAAGRTRDLTPWRGTGWVPLTEGLDSGAPTTLTFIPYAFWANRGPSQMRVHTPMWRRAKNGDAPLESKSLREGAL